MTIDLLIVLVIIALVAGLGNMMLAVEAAVAMTRSRIRGTREQVAKLEGAVRRLHHEEEVLAREIEELGASMLDLRRRQAEVQARLTEVKSKERPRLLILSDRRNPNDKEWIVTVQNTQIAEVDSSHPHALEWTRGRDYLLWADTEQEAKERAMRRFGSRPGYQVKSARPVRENLFPGG